MQSTHSHLLCPFRTCLCREEPREVLVPLPSHRPVTSGARRGLCLLRTWHQCLGQLIPTSHNSCPKTAWFAPCFSFSDLNKAVTSTELHCTLKLPQADGCFPSSQPCQGDSAPCPGASLRSGDIRSCVKRLSVSQSIRKLKCFCKV